MRVSTTEKFDGSKGEQTFVPFSVRRIINPSAYSKVVEVTNNGYLEKVGPTIIEPVLEKPHNQQREDKIISFNNTNAISTSNDIDSIN